MSFRRVRFGQRVAAVSAIVLLLSMTVFDWYGAVGGHGSGNAFKSPGALGALADALLIAACVVAIGTAILVASSRTLGLPVALNAVTTLLGALSMAAVFGRMLFQPGPDEFIELKVWIFVSLFAAGGITFGGWVSMRDEAASGRQAPPGVGKAAG